MKCYSLYPYFTRWHSELSRFEKRSRELSFAFKNHRSVKAKYGGPERSFEQLVAHFRHRFSEVEDIDSGTLFVPVPSSRKTEASALEEWSAYDLASALNEGQRQSLVLRTESLRKSSETASHPSVDGRSNDRRWETQSNTMAFEWNDPEATRICLVDDSITFGATLLGAREAVTRAGFKGEVFAITPFYTWSAELPRPALSLTFQLSKKRTGRSYRSFTGIWSA